MYEYIGILLRARPVLHISRIKINVRTHTENIRQHDTEKDISTSEEGSNRSLKELHGQ
jgi:hypothetical protein